MLNAFWAVVLAAALPANGALVVDAPASSARYTVVHKLHKVDGRSSELEGKAVVKDDGTVLAMVRIPVASFRSGDGNRDEHMIEAMEGGKFPLVVFKGIARLGAGRELPAGPVVIEGELEVHGVKRPLAVPLELAALPDGGLRVRGSFDVSLDAHGVERPSLLFVKVDDACRVDLDLVLRGGR